MTESTPLLLDSPRTSLQSALIPNRNSSRGYPASRSSGSHSHRSHGHPQHSLQRRSHIHPLHTSTKPSPPQPTQYYSSATKKSLPSTPIPPPPSSNSNYKANSASKLLTRAITSLPYHLFCIASPYINPCCGVCCCLTCIRTSEYGIKERWGKFDQVMEPGIHALMWPMEREAGRVSVRMRQLDLQCETKSRDHGMFIYF